jgi:predicted amino acid dehydrogenase
MNKLHFSTMFCGVTFGLLASLSTVQATEVDDVVQSRLGEDVSAQAGYYDDWWTSKGPQGPIRSDLIEANSSDTDYDANVKAMEILVSQENP